MLLRILASKTLKAVLLFFSFQFSVICASVWAAQTQDLSGLTIGQMAHTTWTARDGAPQAVKQIAQAPDGTLWLAGFSGLYTFDGRNFKAFVSPPGEPQLPFTWINTLCITRDGTVWVGMYMGGVVRIKGGHVTIFSYADGESLFFIQQLHQSANGDVWAISNRLNLVKFDESGQWHKEKLPIGSESSTSTVTGYYVDSSKTVWLAQGGRLYRRSLGQADFLATAIVCDVFVGAAETADGSLWLADTNTKTGRSRIQRINPQGALLTSTELPELNGLLIAHDGTFWIPSADKGLLRMTEAEFTNKAGVPQSWDAFTNVDGLASHAMTGIIQDDENNIWIAGERGLDRFRTPRLVRFPSNVGGQWSACGSPDGTTWLATNGEQLYSIRAGTTLGIPKVKDIYSVSCNQPDSVLLLDHTGLWRFQHGRFTEIPPFHGEQQFSILQVVEGKDGTLYARGNKQSGALWMFKGKIWTNLDKALSSRSSTEFLDSQNRLWLGHDGGRIGLLDRGTEVLVPTAGSSLGLVCVITETTRGIFAAGTGGVAVWDGATFKQLYFADPMVGKGITGMVQGEDGSLWLNASSGIVHISSKELDLSARPQGHALQVELIREGEYVGPAPFRRGAPTAAVAPNGDLWFIMETSAVAIKQRSSSAVAALPHLSVGGISADGKPLDRNRKVPPQPQNVSIDYFGLTLTAPEKVIYRIKMDGADQNWQDVGNRDQAPIRSSAAWLLYIPSHGLAWRWKMDGTNLCLHHFVFCLASTRRGGS